jgi:hypothetical protein
MQVLKRIAVVLLELVVEALALGILFGLLLAPEELNSFYTIVTACAPVVLVLFLDGYYLTRPLLGIFWKGTRPWLYAAIAAALFALHSSLAFLVLKSDIGTGIFGKEVIFVAGGVAIVFGCAFAGRNVYLRWIHSK